MAFYSSDSDDEYEDELEEIALLAAAAVIVGIEGLHEDRAASRLPSQRYLRRSQLLPNPRQNTPWQVLYDSQDDRAFITTMGIDCATFHYVLQNGFARRWNTSPIPRADTNPYGAPRRGRRSLTAEGALGLVYHYITSAMSDTALQQIFALVPTTLSRYRRFVLEILRDTLRQLPDAKIEWWTSLEECEEDTNLIVARHPHLRGAIGGIEGMDLIMAESDDPGIENATYSGWLHSHCTSCVLVFSPKGLYMSLLVGRWIAY